MNEIGVAGGKQAKGGGQQNVAGGERGKKGQDGQHGIPAVRIYTTSIYALHIAKDISKYMWPTCVTAGANF